MKIGQLAKQAGVSTAAIRYYERVGVLPEPARRPSGYRDYDEDTLDRLRFIQAGQAVGLTLGELRGVIAFRDRDEIPCAHVLDLIQQRRAELGRRIAQLERTQAHLDALARRARSLQPQDCDPALICHLISAGRGSG
ncbi:MAG: heavy metal-responsive transcriptional regulator [Actinomycetota bacterium]|nr:heavy metal-responsive transcriptional regulator [Actinomycetota bacterium]